MANKDTKYTIEVELKGDSKQVQQAIKDGLNKDFSAKIGADNNKLIKDINNALKELNSSDKKVKIGIDGEFLLRDINKHITAINNDGSLKKLKLGVDKDFLLRDINKAITSINSGDSLKKLKLGVDVNYLQQQLNKAVKGLDTTVKLKTKLETTSRTSETKGTVTTNKTSKEEAQQYQSLFSKRAASIANLDRAYQEFGRNSKEVSAAIREFAAASKDVRKFGRDTGVLSLNKVKSDIERQLGAGLTTDFTKNWLRMEYDKVLKDIDTLNRQLKPEKYEKAEDDARVKAYNQEYKIRQAIAAAQIKADKDAERAYKERERVLNEELKIRLALGKKGLSGGLSVEEVKNIKEANQATTALSSQFARLRGEALKAGNALNQATNPKDVERLRAEFQKAIQALVNYQRATRGLTKGGEAQLVEKLAVGSIKEQTEAYKVLVDWIKKAVQAQRDLDVTTGRKLPRRSKDTDFMSYLNNMDWGRAVSGMAYAARGELNTVQALGNFISSMSQLSGVVGTFAKFLGGIGVALLTFTGIINAASSAFNNLVNILSQVGRAIYDALKPGIELYKLRETAQLSFAATLSNMAVEEGKPISYERGLEMSADLVNRAFMDALKSAFNPEELIRAMQGTLGIAFAKGLNLDQAYNVVKSTAAVAKSIQLQPNQLLQEVRDILQGTLTAKSSQVAYAVGMTPDSLREAQSVGTKIGLTDEGIQQAQEQGRLYEYIMEKMQTYNIALEKYADTFSGAMDRLTESWALAGMKIFEQIAPGLNGVIDNIINDFILTVDENNMPQLSDNLKEVGKALDEIIFKLMADVDALLDFIKEITGEEDTISAIKVLIKDAIDLTALGLAALIFIVDKFKDGVLIAYNAMTILRNIVEVATYFIYGFIDALNSLIHLDFDGMKKKINALEKKTEEFSNKSLKEILMEGTIEDWKDFKGGFGFGHFGKFYQAYGEGHAMYDNKTPKPTDPTKVTPKDTQDTKASYAEDKRRIQALIEDIKQNLKDYINKLKDLQEKNSLSYQQGFKSMEDYFNTKAQLDVMEAQERLRAAQEEYALVASLVPPDANAKYQQDRDLIKINQEIKDAQRKLNKTQEAQLDVLKQLNARQGLMTSGSFVGTSQGSIKDALDYTSNVYNELQGSALVNSQMQLMSVGCVEAVEKAMSAFTTMGDEAYEAGIRGVDALLDYFREKGVQIIPYDRSKLAEGDITFMGHGEDDLWHVVMYHLGQWLGNHGSGDEAITNLHDLDWYEGYYDNVFIAKVSEAADTFKEKVRTALGTAGEPPEATTKLGKEVRDTTLAQLNEQRQAQKELTSHLYNFDEAVEASALILEHNFNEKLRKAEVTYKDQKLADIYRKQNVFDTIQMETEQATKYLDSTLKEMQRTGLARNLDFQYITRLGQDMVDHYFEDAFKNFSNKFSPAQYLDVLFKKAAEAEKAGFTMQAQSIRDKIDGFIQNFVGIMGQWINRAAEYFDMQRNIVDANSGLTNFVKEERKNQLSKGQARWNAKVYEAQVKNLEEQIRLKKEDKNLDEKTREDTIAQLSLEKEKAASLQRYNELLGEQKTLWQETMDAANQALENGLYNFMTDYINTAESIGEAFRNMAIDILKDLQKFFAKKAITDLMHVITGTPNVEYQAPSIADTQTASNTSMMLNQMITANTYLAQIAGQNMIGSSPMLGTSSYGNYNYATSALPPVNSGLGMFGYQDYNTYKALTVSAPGVESSVATSTTQTVAATTGFQNQMVSMLPSLFGSLGGTLIGIINTLGSIAGSLGLLYLTYVAIKYILDAVVEIGHAILDAVVEIGHAILDAVVEIGKEFVKLFAYVAGLILDWNTSAVGLARAIFGNSDDDAVEQTDAVTLLSSILSTLSAIYGVNSAIASKLGVDTKDKKEESAEGSEGSEGDSAVTTTTDTDISDSDTLLEENKMLVDSIYQRRVLEKLELIVSALNTMLRLNIVGLIMQLISIITMANATKSFGSFKKSFGFATGGYISGKGTSTSDSIPAMLSNGEYVIKADSVRRYGLNFLDAVNSGHFTRMKTVIPRFADGGYVGDALQDTARGMTDFAKNIGTSVSTTNNMNVALVRNEQEAYEHFMRSPAGQRILVDFQKGNGRVFARFNR